jgi:hypothetical protein
MKKGSAMLIEQEATEGQSFPLERRRAARTILSDRSGLQMARMGWTERAVVGTFEPDIVKLLSWKKVRAQK